MSVQNIRRLFLTTTAVCVAIVGTAADNAAETRTVQVETLTLKVPTTWEQQPPSNQLRLAQFVIPKAEGVEQPTEMVVSYFGGVAGGADANLTRWIGQFDNAGRQVKTVKGKSEQGTYYLMDVSGSYQMPVGPPILRKTELLSNARMLAVILEVPEKGSFFLKMAGPEATVSQQVDALRASFGGNKSTEQPYEVK